MKSGRSKASTTRSTPARIASLALLLLACSSAARAGSTPGSSLDADAAAREASIREKAAMGDLVAVAYRSNPMIRAARAEWRGAVEKYRVDTAWADPELMAEGMYPADTLGDTAKPMDWSVGLTQAIPLWGRQGSAGKLSSAAAKIAKLKLDAALRDVVVQVRQSAAELRYLDVAVEIVQSQQKLLGKLAVGGAAAYAADRATLYDVMKARAQSGQLDYDALLLEESARTEKARLNALLDRAPDAPIGPVAAEVARPVVYDIPEIDALAEANAEDVRIARAELERSEAMAKLTQYETLPGFKLGVSYGRLNEVNQAGVQATVMLPLRLGKNAGLLGAARADSDKMRAMYAARLNDARTAIRDLAFRLKNAERLATLYRDDLVPQAERAVEIAQVRLSQGLGGLGDAAEAQSAWYGFRLALARAEADRTVLLARLEALAGRSLTEREAAAARPEVAKLNSYTPTPLYLGLAGGETAKAPPPPPVAEVDGFAAASRRLRELAAQWELTLGQRDAVNSFIVPGADLLGALAGAAADPAVAGKALGDGFSLQTLETLTLLRNPMIRTKEAEARAAREVFGQAEQIDAVLRRYAALTATSMGGGGMGAPPDFPFPAVLALKGQIVDEEVRAAREMLEAARRDAVAAARTAYWELIYVDQAAEITSRMIDLLETLDRSVASRYEAGKTSFQDLVRIRIEREKTREELKTLAEERKNRAAEIRGLLALPSEIAVGTPMFREDWAPLPAQGRLETLALARRQEVRAADAMVGRMERMLEMVETMTYPGFDLGLTPAPRGVIAPPAVDSAMGGAAGSSGAGTTVAAKPPLRPFFAADEAYIREIRQRIAALKSEREAARAETLVGVRAAWFAADRARREETLYAAKVLGLSKSALESSLQGYAAGSVGFSDLLESYEGWLEANLAHRRARVDIGIARSGVEAAVGVANLEGLK